MGIERDMNLFIKRVMLLIKSINKSVNYKID